MSERWGLLSEDDRVGPEGNCQSLQWKVRGGKESKRSRKREEEGGRGRKRKVGKFDFGQLNRKHLRKWVVQVH